MSRPGAASAFLFDRKLRRPTQTQDTPIHLSSIHHPHPQYLHHTPSSSHPLVINPPSHIKRLYASSSEEVTDLQPVSLPPRRSTISIKPLSFASSMHVLTSLRRRTSHKKKEKTSWSQWRTPPPTNHFEAGFGVVGSPHRARSGWSKPKKKRRAPPSYILRQGFGPLASRGVSPAMPILVMDRHLSAFWKALAFLTGPLPPKDGPVVIDGAVGV